MNAPLAKSAAPRTTDQTRLDEAIQQACALVTPSWPLDRMVAVNPLWAMTDQPLPEWSARLATRQGARLLMNRSYYRALWDTGRINRQLLAEAAEASGVQASPEQLVQHLESPFSPVRLHTLVALLDSLDTGHHQLWHDEVHHQISQFCGAFFDEGQARWRPDGERRLYGRWLQSMQSEHGIGMTMGAPGLLAEFDSLPGESRTLIASALEALAIPAVGTTAYLHALLLDIIGWASRCAYEQWHENLYGKTFEHSAPLEDLLAIRLAWDWVLFRWSRSPDLQQLWEDHKASWPNLDALNAEAQQLDWVWQEAAERAYQQRLLGFVQAWCNEPAPGEAPHTQALFCLDVRSEVIRRHLEAVDPGIRTLGCAGFFGIPAGIQPAGTQAFTPLLPPLLQPSYRLEEQAPAHAARARRESLAASERWLSFSLSPNALFPYVETLGLAYLPKLLTGKPAASGDPEALASFTGRNTPNRPLRWVHKASGQPLNVTEKAELAAGILASFSLAEGPFAGRVLLVGHKAPTQNNPQAASLHCGACGGQSGATNALALAQLLNEPAVREALAERGIRIPETTRFLPATHDTVTDQIELLDADDEVSLTVLRESLDRAGERARAERAERFGWQPERGPGLLRMMRRRSRDWSEVRPEWGLAGNASFIAAPRQRTRHLRLSGRTFLHEYDWRQDEDNSVLTQIMTAPMVVAHWINFQYYLSTVEPDQYGSGNKVLHNVVGGNLGVFEGNGGDLRIGLPIQSLHDGQGWVHEPLRLTALIEAPRERIDAVLEQHPGVRSLAANGWLHLFRLEDENARVEQYRAGRWQIFS